MGLFSFFGRRKRSKVEPDSVWLTDSARVSGLIERAASRAADGQVVVLAHFPQMLDQVEKALAGRLSFERADSRGDVSAWLASPRQGAVGLALVSQLPEHGVELFGQTEGEVSFLVAERHPHRQQDDSVETLAAALPYSSRLRFHLALEDPLLERFIDDRVKNLLSQLGMSENEELSHPAIASAVEHVQEKLANETGGGERAVSGEEWLDAIEPH